MKFKFVLRWYDIWIGLYWNADKRRLYVLPLPMVGFYLEFKFTCSRCKKKVSESGMARYCGYPHCISCWSFEQECDEECR